MSSSLKSHNSKQDHHVILFKKYKVEMVIGEGSYAKVKLATNIINGQKVALKVIPKTKLQTVSHVKRLKREIRFLKLIQHPHIVKLYEVGELVDEIILVLEYVEGGELFDYIIAKKRFKEKLARKYFRQIVSALSYLHNSCLIHRDLKPENLLIDSHGNLKLADFGFVNFFDYESKLNTFCGSPMYVAPEMVGSRKYVGPEVDIWSLGVCLYVFFVGALPFAAKDPAETQRKILHAEYGDSKYIPQEAKSLIKGMLELDPKKRLTIEEIRHHPWTMSEYNSPPPNYLQDRPPLITLDKEILERTSRMGFNINDLPRRILNDVHSPEFSLYYMVKELMDKNKEIKRRHEKNKEIQEAKQREKENNINIKKSSNSTSSAKNSARNSTRNSTRNSARERTNSSKNSTREKTPTSKEKARSERDKTNSTKNSINNSAKNSKTNSVRERLSPERNKTHSAKEKANFDKEKIHSAREKTNSTGVSEKRINKNKSHTPGNSNHQSINNNIKLNRKANDDRYIKTAESDNYKNLSNNQNDTLNNEEGATNSDETLNENEKTKNDMNYIDKHHSMVTSSHNNKSKENSISKQSMNEYDNTQSNQKYKEQNSSNDIYESNHHDNNENDDPSKQKEIMNSSEIIKRNNYIKEKKTDCADVSTTSSIRTKRSSLILQKSSKLGNKSMSNKSTAFANTNNNTKSNTTPNNDEIYSNRTNLNDSLQYISSPSTTTSLVPLSNNIPIVSSAKPTIQKSQIKRWEGAASENLNQNQQSKSRISTASNADNLYHTSSSSASHRAYNITNNTQGMIPLLSNPPVSSMNEPLGHQQRMPVSSLEKKLNENCLVNNTAKIKAYVINSAYSNVIVKPLGTNNLKEKLTAMEFMNDDNPELENPLNVIPDGRKKSNTSVPSSTKSQTHQSSQSIDYKSFSLSKRKVFEKLNEQA